MCPPTHFKITKPINVVQWMYSCDGLPRPEPPKMVDQHREFVRVLRENGVEVEMIEPREGLPYQHATRDVGTVIGDVIVLSSTKEETRRAEIEITENALLKSRLDLIKPDQGYVEGGDIMVDGDRLWVGVGGRTDQRGAEFLDKTFGRDFNVIPLYFGRRYTHLDTLMGVAGSDTAIIYEPAFEPESLQKIRQAFPRIISLTDREQTSAGANVLSLNPTKLISIAENVTVNAQLTQLGFEVVTVSFSEVIKSGGSVRCDTLPVERDS